MSIILKFFMKYVPTGIKKSIIEFRNELFDMYAKKSYSQEGEDMILDRMFSNKTTGFYVDVGAHHPKRFSNTYYFYKRGWKGVNIDAMPGSMDIFRKIRPRDINLEYPISDKKEILEYFIFNEPALNGFSKELTEFRENIPEKYRVIDKKFLETNTLSSILDKYLQGVSEIDFLSVDVEGLDFEVLKSNDWNKYRPKVILIEILEDEIEDIFKNEVYQYLKKYGYDLYAKSINTVFFRRKDFNNLKYISAGNNE